MEELAHTLLGGCQGVLQQLLGGCGVLAPRGRQLVSVRLRGRHRIPTQAQQHLSARRRTVRSGPTAENATHTLLPHAEGPIIAHLGAHLPHSSPGN